MNPRPIEVYESAYLSDYGFESVMVHYRRKLLLERLSSCRPNIVVEIGCGSELLYKHWQILGGGADAWLIVEPSERFATLARESSLPNLQVIQSFFEYSIEQVQSLLPREPDLVICSGLMHEVPSPHGLTAAMRAVMGPQTRLHINVPNSDSMHRHLALSMGLIANTQTLSERNRNLMQARVYDLAALKWELASAGLRVLNEGGYFIKPFTHEQMQRIQPKLGKEVMDGLFELGKQFPALASEIWVEAMVDTDA